MSPTPELTAETKTARYHALVREEAPKIAAARRGCPDALNWVAEVTLPARRKTAEYFLGHQSLYLPDAIQHGWYGVLRALEKYDASRLVRFSDYCVPQIYNKIGKFRFDVPSQIRVPAWAQEARRKARKSSTNTTETVDKLVADGMSRYVAVIVSAMNFATIQDEYSEEDFENHRNTAVIADTANDAGETTALREEYSWVQDALHSLTKTQLAVVKSEFGFDNMERARNHCQLDAMGKRRRKTYLAALGKLREHAQLAGLGRNHRSFEALTEEEAMFS